MNRHIVRYNRLINHARTLLPEVYEKHHIVPKCMGGTNEDENIIKLSPRLHFLAHYFLSKGYPKNKKIQHAFAMMIVCNPYQSRFINSRLYESAKKARSNALKGVKRPEWVREKMRKPKSITENYHKEKSADHRKNIAKALTGIVREKYVCVHCGQKAVLSNLNRWHNDNCKHKNTPSETILSL